MRGVPVMRPGQEKIKRENERYNYRGEIDNYINRLEGNAQKWHSWYTLLQIILLVFSASTATMAGIDGVPRWIVSSTGVIATIAGGLLATFKIQDRIYASRKAVAEVRLECQSYDYQIEKYKNEDTEGAFIKFSRSINEIQGQQMLQEVELWNPKKEEIKEGITTQSIIQEDQEEKEPNDIIKEPNDIISDETLQGGKLSDNEK